MFDTHIFLAYGNNFVFLRFDTLKTEEEKMAQNRKKTFFKLVLEHPNTVYNCRSMLILFL